VRPVRWLLGAIALAVLLLIGLVGALELSTPRAETPPTTTGRIVHGEVQWEGRSRTWITYVPAQLASPAPLLFALPGSGQTGEHLRGATNRRFEELADRDGFLLVYAEAWAEGGTSGPEWNECRKNTALPAHLENVDDSGFVVMLLERLAGEYEIDRTRVYATGISDGGQMSYRLATEHPDRFAAIASVIAQQAAPENSNCTDPRGPISVLVMNGTDDPIIPWNGGEASFYGFFSAGEVQPIEGTIAHWKRVNAITAPGVRTELPDTNPDDGSHVVRTSWQGESNREVVLYEIVGGGHTIPGGYDLPELLVGPTNRDIVAADEIWAFFRRHALPRHALPEGRGVDRD